MGQSDWDMPRTEEGLQQVLRRLEECRAADDQVEIGNGLMALAFLVKWVRSDTDLPPFDRSHELDLEALEAFRRAGDVKGQVRALVSASAMTAPETRERLLSEAEVLAEGLGEENFVAMVLAARARAMALQDRERATQMHLRVAEIYRRTGNQHGLARCLFGLAIGSGTPAENRDYALEAASLYRAVGNSTEASHCVMIAFMNAEEIEPLRDLEALAQEGLQDSLEAGNRGGEEFFYRKLALIFTEKGEFEEAEKYRRWATNLQDADGLSPLERWKSNVEMTKTMISMAKAQGATETVKAFQEELKRLKANKPKR